MSRMGKAIAWKRRLAAALGRPERLVVMGVGNVDRGDDAAGVCAADLLLKHAGRAIPRLKVIVAHHVPENFTGTVRAFGVDTVLILDAAAGGFPPGTLHLVDPGQIARGDVSTHRTPLSTLAEFLEKTAGCRVVILGIEPGTLARGSRMTPGVRAAAAEAAAYLAALATRRLA
jgi:hydrogenase maturation protease